MEPRLTIKTPLAWALAVAIEAGWVATAHAHAMLEHAEPGVGASVTGAARKIVLHFDSAVQPALSEVHVRDANGREVRQDTLQGDAENPASVSVTVPPLAPGVYRVYWSVTGREGHRVRGDYSFTVR